MGVVKEQRYHVALDELCGLERPRRILGRQTEVDVIVASPALDRRGATLVM